MSQQQPTTAPVEQDNLADDATTEAFGYKQDLRRTLRFFALFGVSFSIISITTGIFLNYGQGLDYWGPASIWLWLIVGAGQLLVAFVVAELGTRIPLAGYAYQWSSRLVNSSYGWFVGFLGLMYMTVGGGAIILEGASPLLISEWTSAPNARLVLTLAILMMVVSAVINVISVQLTARINSFAVITEIVGTLVFGVLLLVLYGIGNKPTGHSMSFLFNTSTLVHHNTFYAIVMAALLGSFTLVGFELAADMSEETVNARFNVPRAVIIAVAGAVTLGFVALIGFTVAIPDLATVQKSSEPLLTIAGYWLPSWLVKVFVAFVVFSMFAITVIGSAAQSRLVFSMARDNMLPFSKAFQKVHARTQTPIVALVVFGVIDIAFMWYGYLQSNSFGTLVGATSIIPYLIYFLITVAYANKRKLMESVPGAFNLGRWAPLVIAIVLCWTFALILSLAIPSEFHGADKVVVGALILALLWYVLVLRGRIKRGEAGVRPLEEMLDEVSPK